MLRVRRYRKLSISFNVGSTLRSAIKEDFVDKIAPQIDDFQIRAFECRDPQQLLNVEELQFIKLFENLRRFKMTIESSVKVPKYYWKIFCICQLLPTTLRYLSLPNPIVSHSMLSRSIAGFSDSGIERLNCLETIEWTQIAFAGESGTRVESVRIFLSCFLQLK